MHLLITEVIETSVAHCTTIFRPAAHYTVDDGTAECAVVVVEIKILRVAVSTNGSS